MRFSQNRKDFFKYATLNMLGMLGLSCYILADTFFVANGVGADGLTALNLAIPVYSFIHGCGLMLGMGGAIKYAIYKSQGEEKNADAMFTNVLFMGAAFAVLFFIIGSFFSGPAAQLLGADAGVFAMTQIYLKIILLFSPMFLLNDIMLCFVRNDGNPRLSMLAMVGGSLSNIVLDYIFIFPLNLGIYGAVLATGIAPMCSLLILSPYLFQHKNGFHFRKTGFHKKMGGWVIALGIPSLVTEVSSGIVIIVFNNIILGLQGNVGVAAYGVVANLSLCVIAVFTGLAQGVQPLISRAYGYGDLKTVKQVLRYAVTALALLAGLIYLGVFFGAGQITMLFNRDRDSQLQDIAAAGLRLYFIGAPFAGFNIIMATFFVSLEQALPAHLVSLIRGLVLIVPMAFLLAALAGILGVWLSFPVTECCVSVLAGAIFWKVRKNINKS